MFSEKEAGPSPIHPGWRVLVHTEQGSKHRRTDSPNQDAVIFREIDPGKKVIAAVADGHGSKRYVRSGHGAQFAVAAAQEVLSFIATTYPEPKAIPPLINGRDIAHWVVTCWQKRVRKHIHGCPFSADELALLGNGEEPNAGGLKQAYGSTLVAALVTPLYHLYLQIGDGDLLVVAENGQVTRPMPLSLEHMGVETASLVQRTAEYEIEVHLEVLSTPPALIMLTTDGYANSYATNDEFHAVATEYLDILRKHAWRDVQAHLGPFLQRVTNEGSGDDVSIAMIVSEGMLRESGATIDEARAATDEVGRDD